MDSTRTVVVGMLLLPAVAVALSTAVVAVATVAIGRHSVLLLGSVEIERVAERKKETYVVLYPTDVKNKKNAVILSVEPRQINEQKYLKYQILCTGLLKCLKYQTHSSHESTSISQ